MTHVPEYKAGDYLECGEGTTYSRILILSENTVLVKDGEAVGTVMELEQWYSMIGDRKESIQNTSYFEMCDIYDYYLDESVNIPLDSLDSKSGESISISTTHSSSTLTTTSMLILRDVDFDQEEHSEDKDIVKEETAQEVVVIEKITVPPRKNSWGDWFIRIFLCGFMQTEETREKPT